LPASIEGPAARFGRNLAVVIGIDRYGDGVLPLRSAVADATKIAEALRRDHGFETWELLNEDASRAHLLALLSEELPAALGPDDRLLLYFAGHGIALDGDSGPAGYLLPADSRRADRDGFLSMHVVNRALTRLSVRHVLVILDCCFAGTFRWSSLRDVEPATARIYRERYDRYVESSAWQVLTSASADQLALDMLADDRGEGTGAHSPFALALLDGLGGAADYTGDHVITASELAIFVREHVTPAAETAGHRQIPQLFPLNRHDCGEFVFQVPGRTLALEPAPPLDAAANPYRGLESFREQDRALFFGRAEAARRLVDTVIGQQLTVVVGPSGAGKSSLVHAALMPELRERGWTVLPTQRPGRDPLAALEVWGRALRPDPSPNGPVAAWLTSVVRRNSAQPDRPWLVVIDQFEELLGHRTAERDRAAFLGALASALNLSPSLHLVLTVRSDLEPQFHDTSLGPWWTAARFIVPGLTHDELREIIVGPATAAVLCFEPSSLVDRLLDDVALVPAPLPLLSFALSELYRRCEMRWRSGVYDRSLCAVDYDEMGSVARALTHRATALHDQLVTEDAAYAITIRNVFTRMVAVMGGETARCRVPTDELAYDDPDEDRRVAEVLQRFHDARLISLGTEDCTGEPVAYAEPTHDALVRGWTRVSRWLEELDTPFGTRALLGAVGGAARSWQAGGQASELLWSDARADLALGLVRGLPFVFNTCEAQFVAYSARLRRNRQFRVVGSLAAVICVLVVAVGVSLWQRQIAIDNADRATASDRRAIASDQRATDNERRATAGQIEAECLRYQSAQEWSTLASCAERLHAINPAVAKELKNRVLLEMCRGYEREQKWGELDLCAERLHAINPAVAKELKNRVLLETCRGHEREQKWGELDLCAEQLQEIDLANARELKKRAVLETCRAQESALQLDDLVSCVDRLKQIDPAAAKEFQVSKILAFGAAMQAFESMMQEGNLAQAKVELNAISTAVTGYATLREKYESKAIELMAARLRQTSSCDEYHWLVNDERERDSTTPRIIAEAMRRVNCNCLEYTHLDEMKEWAAKGCLDNPRYVEKAVIDACDGGALDRAMLFWNRLPATMKSRAPESCILSGIDKDMLNTGKRGGQLDI
jgi:hypothetical protein